LGRANYEEEAMSENVRCKRCGNLVSADQAKYFHDDDMLYYLNGVYCPTCYGTYVDAEYQKLLDLLDLNVRAAKASFVKTLFDFFK
jgi:hypothetical protein